MDASDDNGKAETPEQAPGTDGDTALGASSAASDRPFGPDAATIQRLNLRVLRRASTR